MRWFKRRPKATLIFYTHTPHAYELGELVWQHEVQYRVTAKITRGGIVWEIWGTPVPPKQAPRLVTAKASGPGAGAV